MLARRLRRGGKRFTHPLLRRGGSTLQLRHQLMQSNQVDALKLSQTRTQTLPHLLPSQKLAQIALDLEDLSDTAFATARQSFRLCLP